MITALMAQKLAGNTSESGFKLSAWHVMDTTVVHSISGEQTSL